MKFCEKLQKLRKEKGYSQEQLADLLDVSRQSVSKWESGTTYPEMDKLLSLCKIFDVTLDDLTNDEITDRTIKSKQYNNILGNIISNILEMINKSIEMFQNMNKRDIIMCISELTILVVILLFFKLPFDYINNLAENIFSNFSHQVDATLTSIWLFLSNIIYLILFVTIFIYVYKMRFLDKFTYEYSGKKPKEKNEAEITTTSSDVSSETEPKDIPKKPKIKTSFVLFNVLGTIFNVFIKICLIIFIIPLIICFVLLVICTTIVLIMEFLGIHYIGILILLLGGAIVVEIIMELFVRTLINCSYPIPRMFIVFVCGLILFGIGTGITAYEISSTKYVDEVPADIKLTTIESTYNINENFFVRADVYYDSINYEIDNSLKDEAQITFEYYDDYLKIDTFMENDYIIIRSYSLWDNTLNYLNLLKNDLKNKTLHNYELLSKVNITITTSSENIVLIKENEESYYESLQTKSEEYDYYIDEINRLYEEINSKDNQINDLEEKIIELEEKLDNIYTAIE